MSADVSASSVSHTGIGVNPVRALERVLYRCAKQDRDRHLHTLVGHVARSDVSGRGRLPHPSGRHGCVCQSVNDVGEPCAGNRMHGSMWRREATPDQSARPRGPRTPPADPTEQQRRR